MKKQLGLITSLREVALAIFQDPMLAAPALLTISGALALAIGWAVWLR